MSGPVAVAAVAALASLVAGCSDGGDGPSAVTSGDICGGFTRAEAARSALTALTGGDRLTQDAYEPDATLKALREADGRLSPRELASGTLFCRLRKAGDAEPALTVDFREALVIPRSPGDDTFTAFATGAEAKSSTHFAKILFHCPRPAPAKPLIVAAELERSNKTSLSPEDLAAHQITVLNAAARAVAERLGCEGTGTGLVEGVPSRLAAQ